MNTQETKLWAATSASDAIPSRQYAVPASKELQAQIETMVLAAAPPAAPVQEKGQSCYCPNCEALSKQLAAQRQWVGLTTADLDEIDAPIRERGSATIAEIYRAIEAKLKAKNGSKP